MKLLGIVKITDDDYCAFLLHAVTSLANLLSAIIVCTFSGRFVSLLTSLEMSGNVWLILLARTYKEKENSYYNELAIKAPEGKIRFKNVTFLAKTVIVLLAQDLIMLFNFYKYILFD